MNEDTVAALSNLTCGLYLLTTGTIEKPYGMIVSWTTQISYEPPLIMVAVRVNRHLHDLIPRFGCFALNVIPLEEDDLLNRFKKAPPEARFKGLETFSGASGAPLVRSALAYLDCELKETYRPGDHSLFIGQILEGRSLHQGRPFTTIDCGHIYLGRF